MIIGKAGNIDNSTPHRAGDYDIQVRQTIPCYDLIQNQVLCLVRNIKASPVMWLDTGCGTGNLILSAINVFPLTQFVLSDPSPDMLDICRSKLVGPDAERVLFLPAGSTQSLVWDEKKPFDVITAIQAHHYLNPAGRVDATHRCYDLLADGGLYISFENIRPLTEPGVSIALNMVQEFQLGAGKPPADVEQHRARFDTEYFPITVEEHLQNLRLCGYTVVEMLWYSYMQAGFYAIK